MKRRIMRMALTAAMAVPLLTSCFVKEDRGLCPCWIELDLKNVKQEQIRIGGWNGSELFAIRVKPEEYPDYYEMTSPRGELYLSAIWPVSLPVREESISVPKGQQADSVYAYSSRLNTNCETVRDVVRMHKQFATVHLKMQIPDGFDYYPYRVVIRGNTAGWDIRDFSGITGQFEYEPELEGLNEFSIRVPRQADKSLTAELYSANEKVDEFRLGEIIAQTGFDWNAEELADISLEVNFTTSTVLAHISDWLDTIILNVKM